MDSTDFIPNEEDIETPEIAESGDASDNGDTKRERSTIQFPYGDLDDAVAVATAVFKLGGSCGLDQLAHELGHQTVNSGGFQSKVTAAQIFGTVERDRKTVKLTELGRRIIQPDLAAQAKVDAFLGVALYRKVFDNYRGTILPPDQGLENYLKGVGVASKVADRSRQTLQRSALQAGFFSHGTRNKLIIPPGCSEDGASSFIDPASQGQSGGGGDDGGTAEVQSLRREVERLRSMQGNNLALPNLPPAIVGVLTTLPLGSDEKWTAEDLSEWTQMFEVVIKRAFRDKIEKSPTPSTSSSG